MSKPDKSCLGFVGLGVMGAPMVLRLLDEGYAVTVWNREPERADEVTPHGAQWAGSPAEVRAASDIVIFCVLDSLAVESCCFGERGIATVDGGADLLIDCSTIPPADTRRYAERLAKAGMDWVDAPISGGPERARKGGLAIMAGGGATAFARARPALDVLAGTLTHMGPLGAGQTAKMANQAIVGVNYVLMAEVLAMTERAGIDTKLLPRAFRGGAADSVILQTIYRQMQSRELIPPKAYARQLDKDLKNLQGFTAALDLDLPVIRAACMVYHAHVGAGYRDADSASVVLHYEKAST